MQRKSIQPKFSKTAAAVALALAAGYAATAAAQEPGAAPEEITVTGSRIVRDGMNTPTVRRRAASTSGR